MIVGWLEDMTYRGGAELDGEALRSVAPFTCVHMPPGHVADADLYVVGNCVHYRPQDISQLADAPVTKIVNDAWRYGHPRVREQLIDRADLFILRSPIHQERLEWDCPKRKWSCCRHGLT